MRKCCLIVSLILWLVACRHEKHELLTSSIEYDVELGTSDVQSWSLADQQRFILSLLDAVDQGMAKDAHGFQVDWRILFSRLKASGLQDSFSIDSLKYFLLHRVQFVRFREKWLYDKEHFHFFKQVETVAPGIKISIDGDSLHAGYDKWIPLFWVETSPTIQHADMQLSYFVSHVFVRNDVEDVLDTYDSIYPSFCKLPRISRDTFYIRLMRAFENKQIPVYNMFFQPFTLADYKRYFELKKFFEEDSSFQNYFHPSYFARIKFIENWLISFNPLGIHKTVVAYSPSQVVFESSYDMIKGYRLLFWVVQDTTCLKIAQEHGFWM